MSTHIFPAPQNYTRSCFARNFLILCRRRESLPHLSAHQPRLGLVTASPCCSAEQHMFRRSSPDRTCAGTFFLRHSFRLHSICAAGGTRTRTLLKAGGFESPVSTNSTTAACAHTVTEKCLCYNLSYIWTMYSKQSRVNTSQFFG